MLPQCRQNGGEEKPLNCLHYYANNVMYMWHMMSRILLHFLQLKEQNIDTADIIGFEVELYIPAHTNCIPAL